MIVQESDLLLQALDRRLQVDRALALDPLKAVAGSLDEGTSTATTTSTGAASANATPSAQSALTTRLPLGRIVSATVVEIGDTDHVVVEVDQWRVALAWPPGAAPFLLPGQQLSLRVLAHQPMLLFQSVDAAGEAIESDDAAAEVQTHWSQNALQLSRQTVAATTRGTGGVVRFTEPLLLIKSAPRETTPLAEHIALDDVIVGRATAGAVSTQRPGTDAIDRAPSLPVVLQGPAWPGQPMELVVRRERGDDVLDNPALDAWCGDISIELPMLGRVFGRLAFSMQGLRIRLEGDDAGTVASMHEASAMLATALTHADLRVQSLSIGNASGSNGPSLGDEARSAFIDRE